MLSKIPLGNMEVGRSLLARDDPSLEILSLVILRNSPTPCRFAQPSGRRYQLLPGIRVSSNTPATDEFEEEETQLLPKREEFCNRYAWRKTEVKEESQKNHPEESKLCL